MSTFEAGKWNFLQSLILSHNIFLKVMKSDTFPWVLFGIENNLLLYKAVWCIAACFTPMSGPLLCVCIPMLNCECRQESFQSPFHDGSIRCQWWISLCVSLFCFLVGAYGSMSESISVQEVILGFSKNSTWKSQNITSILSYVLENFQIHIDFRDWLIWEVLLPWSTNKETALACW